MENYSFDLVKREYPDQKDQLTDDSWIKNRSIIRFTDNLEKGAKYFIPSDQLIIAINTAIAVGEPLLVTGEPGTGKTQIAYYIAYKLNLGEVLHFQVKSTSKAQDLLYNFDTVRYFHDAHLAESKQGLKKEKYIRRGPLYRALEAERPSVLLIDEIDKAPRDFPNDLLLELDQNKFEIPELDGLKISGLDIHNRPIIVITSNSERRLPEPFLRRCIYHYIQFDDSLLQKAVYARKDEYPNMSETFLNIAIARFVELRKANLRKKPSTGELLTWIRVMATAANIEVDKLKGDLSQLPYLGALLKDHSDLQEVEKPRI